MSYRKETQETQDTSKKKNRKGRIPAVILAVLLSLALIPSVLLTDQVAEAAENYSIAKAAPTGGTFSVPGSGTAGSTITISNISPGSGYSIGAVNVIRSDNRQAVPVDGSGFSRTFIMPDSAVTVAVSFVLNTNPGFYYITKLSPDNGSFNVPTKSSMGVYVMISDITPDPGYSIGEVLVTRNDNGQALKVSGSGVNQTFKMEDSDVTVSVTFVNGTSPSTYRIIRLWFTESAGTYNVPTSGKPGETITISEITPAYNFIVRSVVVFREDNDEMVKVNGDGTGSSVTFIMPDCPVMVAVEFIEMNDLFPFPYAVFTEESENGTFSTSMEGLSAYAGDTIWIYAAPYNGYSVDAVSVIGSVNGQVVAVSGTGTQRSFVMPAFSVAITVTFVPITYVETYSITKVTPINGAFSIPGSASAGSTVTISAITPNPGYSINSISAIRDDEGSSVEVSGSGAQRSFIMPDCPVTVSIAFIANTSTGTYNIAKIAPTNGTFSVSSSGVAGSTITISNITPGSGYSIGTVSVIRSDNRQPVTVDGSGFSRTFIMPDSEVYVTVSFVLNTNPGFYYITSLSPENGSFNVPTKSSMGAYVMISDITPDPGYSIGEVLVTRNDNGQVLKVSGSGAYQTFKMEDSDVTVSVTFIAN